MSTPKVLTMPDNFGRERAHILRMVLHILIRTSKNRGRRREMPEEQRENEPRRATGAGDVDDLIFHGDQQPNISDR